MLATSRRSFLTGLGALLAAPAIVHAGNLMPISARALVADFEPVYLRAETEFGMKEIVETTLRNRTKMLAESMTRNNALLVRLNEDTPWEKRLFADLRGDIEAAYASH